MHGQPVMRALAAYDQENHHQAKTHSHPVYATTRSGPEPQEVIEATGIPVVRSAVAVAHRVRCGDADGEAQTGPLSDQMVPRSMGFGPARFFLSSHACSPSRSPTATSPTLRAH